MPSRIKRWRKKIRISTAAFAALCGAASCQFDKAVDIPIPQDPPKLFVECYLQDSLPPRLLLTYTQGYFDSVSVNAVLSGTVYLEAPDGSRIDLSVGLYEDKALDKIYNWGATDIIRLHEGDVWKLTAQDTKGHTLSGTSTVMHKIPIDSVTYLARDNDTAAYVASWVKDPAGVTNYYRQIVNADSAYGGSAADNAFQDGYRDGQEVPIRTGYNLHIGDTAYVRVFSLEQAYFLFLQSETQAKNNNGNPFAQPNPLISTVTGGAGAFTTLVYDERIFVIRDRQGRIL